MLIGAGAVGAVAATLAAVAYGVERVALRRLRGRPEGGAAARTELVPIVDRSHEITTSDGAVLQVFERGIGRPVVLLHGYALAAAVWALQFETWSSEAAAVEAGGRCGSLPTTSAAMVLRPRDRTG